MLSLFSSESVSPLSISVCRLNMPGSLVEPFPLFPLFMGASGSRPTFRASPVVCVSHVVCVDDRWPLVYIGMTDYIFRLTLGVSQELSSKVSPGKYLLGCLGGNYRGIPASLSLESSESLE